MKSKNQRLKLARIKAKIAGRTLVRILTIPGYALFALFLAIFMSAFILWQSNIELVWYIIRSSIPLGSKLDFFTSVYRSIFQTYSIPTGVGMLLFSVLFGINFALLLYLLWHRQLSKIPTKSSGSSLLLAIFGGGCVACGTSILSPLLISLGVGSTVLIERISSIAFWGASILLLYSIYRLAAVSATDLQNQ